MLPTKKDLKATSILNTDPYKIFRSYGEKCLIRILTYLYWTKFKEINICHLDVYNNVFSKKNGINSPSILYTGLHNFFRSYGGNF